MTYTPPTAENPVQKYGLLALFLILVIGAGSLIGTATAPGEWYAGLDKPFFNPPNWIFAPVWTVIYVCIAVAGWRTFQQAPKGRAMQLWVAQLVLNWFWSPVFFTWQLLWPALVVIVAIWMLIAAFIAVSWLRDRLSAMLFTPYIAWVSFATLLNAAVAWLN